MIEIGTGSQSIGEEENVTAGVDGDGCLARRLQPCAQLPKDVPGVVIVRIDLYLLTRRVLACVVFCVATEGMVAVMAWAVEALAVAEVSTLQQESQSIPTSVAR